MLAKTEPTGRVVYDGGYDSDEEYQTLHTEWVLSEMVKSAFINLRTQLHKRWLPEPYIVLDWEEFDGSDDL